MKCDIDSKKKLPTRTHFEIEAIVNSKHALQRQEKMADYPVRSTSDVVTCKVKNSKQNSLEDQIQRLSVCKKKSLLNEDLITIIFSN